MTLYRRRSTQPLKWVVALIVFALALGITFTEVYGNSGLPSTGTGDNGRPDGPPEDGQTGLATANNGGTHNATAAIPEPAILVLLAGGLSALYLARRRKMKNK